MSEEVDTTSTTSTSATPAPEMPAAQTTATAAGAQAGQQGQSPAATPAPITFADETALQAEIDKRLKDRLERERKKSDVQAEKARAEAERKTLEEQGNFKLLHEKAQARVGELEAAQAEAEAQAKALTEKVERYEAALTAHRDASYKTIPESIRKLLEKMDLAEQLEWLSANAATLAPPTTNINATRRNGGGAALPEETRNELAAIYGVNPKYLTNYK